MIRRREWGHAAFPPFVTAPDIACRTSDAQDFFPPEGKWAEAHAATAKRICRRCPRIDECLTWAIETRQDYGVWGGTTPEERRHLIERVPA